MKTIHKYELRIDDEQVIPIHPMSTVLSIQYQRSSNRLVLWAMVDTTDTPSGMKILCRGTGHKLTGEEGAYLGTVQMAEGHLVWHFFQSR